MKKTHFLTLDFHPGDFCWVILYEGETASAVKLIVTRVIHTFELCAAKEGEENEIPKYKKNLFYNLSDGSTVMSPLHTKEEAEKMIRDNISPIVRP